MNAMEDQVEGHSKAQSKYLNLTMSHTKGLKYESLGELDRPCSSSKR